MNKMETPNDLTEEMEKLRSKVSALEEKNRQNEEMNQCNEDIISEYNDRILELEGDIQKLTSENDQYKRMNEYNEQIIDELTKKSFDLEEKNREIERALEENECSNQGNEDIISDLVAKNFSLEEQNTKLAGAVSDLETINQCNEEIMESMKEMEKSVQLQLEREFVQNSSLNQQIAEWKNREDQYETVIQKFRQKISELNHEVQSQKDEIAGFKAIEEERGNSSASSAGDGGGPDTGSFSLFALNVNRTFAEIVDAEVRAVELESIRQQLAYTRDFLPENFGKQGGDQDCLLMCTLFPRLSQKAMLLVRLLAIKFPQAQGGLRREHVTLAHKAEQWSHAKHFTYLLYRLNTIAQRFILVLKSCSMDRLSRIAIQQPDIDCQVKHLDHYIDLLRQNRFDENTTPDWIERMFSFLLKLFETNLSSEPYCPRDDLINHIVQIKEGLSWAQFNCARLKFFIKADANKAATGGAEHSIIKFIDDIVVLLVDCESLAMRALNRMPKENELMINSETYDRLFTAIAGLEKMMKIINQICAMATSQLMAVDADGLEPDQVNEFLLSSVEKFVGTVDAKQVKAIVSENILPVKTFLHELSGSLENSSMEISASNIIGFPPLLERAQRRKNDVVEAENLRWQVTKKDEELLRLQKTLKAKDGDISTLKLRLEMADMQAGRGEKMDDAQINRLKLRCDELQEDLQMQKMEYDKSIEQLQKQLDQAEHDRAKQKEQTREFSKRALFANMINNMSVAPPTSPFPYQQHHPNIDLSSTYDPNNTSLFAANEDAIKWLENALISTHNNLDWALRRIRILENDGVKSLVAELGDLSAPLDVCCGVYTLRYADRDKKKIHGKLQQLFKESEGLIDELNNNLIEPLDPKQRALHRQKLATINLRINNIASNFGQLRVQNLSETNFKEVTQRVEKTDEKSPSKGNKKCHSILDKWNAEVSTKEKWYSNVVRRRSQVLETFP